MSSPFPSSASDVLAALQIVRIVQETWFTRFNRADPQYLDFGNDVAQFGGLLESLFAALENASQARRRQMPPAAFGEWDAHACRARQEVVGNFARTLEECYMLLQQNAGYLSKTSLAWDNATWHLSGSSDTAERLRTRLQLHAAKINLLVDFDTNPAAPAIRDSRQFSLYHGQQLPPVPLALAERYRHALNLTPPPAFYSIEQFPIAEGLDALVAAFESSTVSAPASRSALRMRSPSVEQMNQLIKARFLFNCVRDSMLFRSHAPDSFWTCALETAHGNLQQEYHRWYHVLEQNTQAIAALGPEFFRIWTPSETVVADPITGPDERQAEEKLLEAPLQLPREQFKKDLIVFRRPGSEFRLLTCTSLNSPGGDSTIHDESKVVSVHSAQVIPRYALPPYGQNTPDTCDFELCFPGASSGDLYRFLKEDDRYAFQQALLGYKVVFQDTANWQIHRSRLKGKIGGTGLVQIFQAKTIQPANARMGALAPPSPDTRRGSVFSQESAFTAASRASSAVRSNGAIIAEYPHAPLVVIFTKIDGQLTFLRIPLTHDVHIQRSRCDCASDNKSRKENCHATVLESSLRFPLQRFSSQTEAQWNLALFGLPLHPDFDRRVESVKHVNYLSIETSGFASAFQKALETVMKIRDRMHDEFEASHHLVAQDIEPRSPGGPSSALSTATTMPVQSSASLLVFELPDSSYSMSSAAEMEKLRLGKGLLSPVASHPSTSGYSELADTSVSQMPAELPDTSPSLFNRARRRM